MLVQELISLIGRETVLLQFVVQMQVEDRSGHTPRDVDLLMVVRLSDRGDHSAERPVRTCSKHVFAKDAFFLGQALTNDVLIELSKASNRTNSARFAQSLTGCQFTRCGCGIDTSQRQNSVDGLRRVLVQIDVA